MATGESTEAKSAGVEQYLNIAFTEITKQRMTLYVFYVHKFSMCDICNTLSLIIVL